MNSIFRSVDYKTGRIDHIEEGLVLDLPLANQIDLLREDMLQVTYNGGEYIIDVGWYPEFKTEGQFAVVVIEDHDWVSLIYKSKTADIAEMKQSIIDAVSLIRSLIEDSAE